MNKEENFIIMSVVLGSLLLLVAILMIVAKPDKNLLVDRDIVRDDTNYKEEENTKKFIEVQMSNTENHITSNFEVMGLPLSSGKHLLYKSKYVNYYLIDIDSDNVYITYQGENYLLKDALEKQLISIYDFIEKIGKDKFYMQDRYELSSSDRVINHKFMIGNHYLSYSNVGALLISVDGSSDKSLEDYLAHELTINDFEGLLRYMAGKGQIRTYKLLDGKSYMYEIGNDRIYFCNNDIDNNIYIGDKEYIISCD